jgi:hypothetical protein
VKERLPIKKSIFWSDLGVARKIYRNLAIIPRVQDGPSPQELQKRVTKLMFPRVSKIDFGASVSPTNDRFRVPNGSDERLSKVSEGQSDMDRSSMNKNSDEHFKA